jgi:mannose-6-phosphate isomerase-like protein (cupin superfamily)
MEIEFQISIEEAKLALTQSGERFATVIKNGSMRGVIYEPKDIDNQTPHKQDEVYIVMEGSGKFIWGGKVASFKKGDFLFVPAGLVHRFENFTEDLLLWVVFYGEEHSVSTNNNH